MGVIEGTYITLTNYTKKKIEDLERGEKLLSCKIEGLEPMSHSNIAMSWTKKDPTILKEESPIKYTSTNSVAIYRIINNKLKISLDHVIFTKDGETDECSWNNVKSLRRGDLIFNESYEFEEITSLKKIKEGVSMVVLSLSGYPYYFANGYLIHNSVPCENCDFCHWWQQIFTPFGPHTWNESIETCHGGHAAGDSTTQKSAHDTSRTITIATGQDTSNLVEWNMYTGKLYYTIEAGVDMSPALEDPDGPDCVYLYKRIDGWILTTDETQARQWAFKTKAISSSYYSITYAGYTPSDTYRSAPQAIYTGDANSATQLGFARYGVAGYNHNWHDWPITTTCNTNIGGNPNMQVSSGVTVDTFRMYYKIVPGEAYIWRIYKNTESTPAQTEPESGWAHVRETGT